MSCFDYSTWHSNCDVEVIYNDAAGMPVLICKSCRVIQQADLALEPASPQEVRHARHPVNGD